MAKLIYKTNFLFENYEWIIVLLLVIGVLLFIFYKPQKSEENKQENFGCQFYYEGFSSRNEYADVIENFTSNDEDVATAAKELYHSYYDKLMDSVSGLVDKATQKKEDMKKYNKQIIENSKNKMKFSLEKIMEIIRNSRTIIQKDLDIKKTL